MKSCQSTYSITLLLFLLTLLHNFPSSHGAFSDASMIRHFLVSNCRNKSDSQGSILVDVNQLLSVQNPKGKNIMTIHNNRRSIILGYSRDERPKVYEESEKRGAFLLSLALLLCVWSFSIPVEFRRDHWCFTSQCASNRSACYDCITFGEWFQKVREYYATGGGIHFDFTVEDNKKP